MRAVVVVVVVALAVVGALLHPLSLLLGFLPWNATGLLLYLDDVKLAIADVLGWVLVALLTLMLVLVIKSRVFPAASGRRPGQAHNWQVMTFMTGSAGS